MKKTKNSTTVKNWHWRRHMRQILFPSLQNLCWFCRDLVRHLSHVIYCLIKTMSHSSNNLPNLIMFSCWGLSAWVTWYLLLLTCQEKFRILPWLANIDPVWQGNINKWTFSIFFLAQFCIATPIYSRLGFNAPLPI